MENKANKYDMLIDKEMGHNNIYNIVCFIY
jgi:hypothetical protein